MNATPRDIQARPAARRHGPCSAGEACNARRRTSIVLIQVSGPTGPAESGVQHRSQVEEMTVMAREIPGNGDRLRS